MQTYTSRVVANGFQFPEGPAFDEHGNCYLVNLQGGSISRVTPQGESSIFVETGGKPNGAAFHQNGNLYVADSGLKAIISITPQGEIETVADSYAGEPLRGPNDLVFMRDGSCYFTDPVGSSLDKRIGRVYQLSFDRSVRLLFEGLAFPNGVALSPDEKYLYVAETHTKLIHRFTLGRGGSFDSVRVWANVHARPEDLGPDGMAFDAKGNLYVAIYGGSAVRVLSPGGNIIAEIPLPDKNPTNCAFGGPYRSTLYITGSETGTLFAADIGIPGQVLFSGQ